MITRGASPIVLGLLLAATSCRNGTAPSDRLPSGMLNGARYASRAGGGTVVIERYAGGVVEGTVSFTAARTYGDAIHGAAVEFVDGRFRARVAEATID